MTSTTILNLKTPSQDAQGRWYETLSPTQVLTAQRLRRRLRQQGFGPDTITELVNQKINLQRRQQHDEAIQYNRIPQSAQHKNNYQDTVSSIYFSTIIKKQKMTNNEIEQVTTNGTSETQRSKSKKQINHNKDYSYIPNYLKVSNRIFKKMLISSLEGAKKIVKRLNSKDKINYIRQYAYLIHRLFYVQLQESQ
ncbi:unnamed protein product [Rotaria sp. Silwood1]|nr:unnamed protein product [Rotaria sp. Silwood1]